MDTYQDYNDYVKYSINYLLSEDRRPLRFYKILEILKTRIACSESQAKKALEELVRSGTITRNENGMYLYVG